VGSCDLNLCPKFAECESSSTHGYLCECPNGQTGKHCETNSLCENEFNPCKNNGKCETIDTEIDTEILNAENEKIQTPGYQCTCAADSTGINCEIEITSCDKLDCGKNGKCDENMNKIASCTCETNYFGELCEKSGDPTLNKPVPDDDGSVSGVTVMLRVLWVGLALGVVGFAVNNVRRAESKKDYKTGKGKNGKINNSNKPKSTNNNNKLNKTTGKVAAKSKPKASNNNSQPEKVRKRKKRTK